jgi:hypothetical protein
LRRARHRDVRNFGNEIAWRERRAIDPIAEIAGAVGFDAAISENDATIWEKTSNA